MTSPNDRAHAYDWRCDHCRARNVESDPVCWYCGAGFLDEPPDDARVTMAAVTAGDIAAEISNYFSSQRAPSPAVVDRLAARFGGGIVHRELRRHLRQENKRLEREVRHAKAAWLKRHKEQSQ
jgi:hypothetical protein